MSVYEKENPEYLKQAIDSMLNQTYKPDQFVIVEDGKLNEELYSVLNYYSEKYSDIICRYPLKSNYGLGVALDKGLEICRNGLVARMDSDDIAVNDRCEKQIKLFEENPGLSIVSGCIAEFVGDISNVISIRDVPERHEAIKRRMRTRSAFNHPAVMYKKSEVVLSGGYGNLKRKQDHDLFSRMMNNGCRAYNIQDIVLYFRADKGNLKRRKSWTNCKSYIIAEWNVFLRHECSFRDLIFVVMAQVLFLLLPNNVIGFITKKCLRKKYES